MGHLLSSGLHHQDADSGFVYEETWEAWCRLGGRRNPRLMLWQFVYVGTESWSGCKIRTVIQAVLLDRGLA